PSDAHSRHDALPIYRGLGYRLENQGIKGVQARHRAVCMHLHHERPYRDAAVLRRNRQILDRIRRTGETRARRGLAELRRSAAERSEEHTSELQSREK